MQQKDQGLDALMSAKQVRQVKERRQNALRYAEEKKHEKNQCRCNDHKGELQENNMITSRRD